MILSYLNPSAILGENMEVKIMSETIKNYINPKNAVAFFGKRNLWSNTASGAPIAEQWVGLSKYSHT